MTPEAAGAELRARREAAGLSLDDVAEETRIPVSHLEAVERGDLDALPPPPYRQGYVRAVYAHLGVPLPAEVLAAAGPGEEGPAGPTVPLWVPRVAAAVACAALVGVLVVTLGPRGGSAAVEEPVGIELPDQVVSVEVLRTAAFEVVVDGEVVLDRRVPGGETFEVAGHERVEVQLEAAETARVRYNGEIVTPQGRQDTPRRHVFIDDLHVSNRAPAAAGASTAPAPAAADATTSPPEGSGRQD